MTNWKIGLLKEIFEIILLEDEVNVRESTEEFNKHIFPDGPTNEVSRLENS